MTTGWERLATFEGGTVSGMARAQAADGSWHVFAATPVGVFCSVDRGHSWAPLGTGARVAGAQVVAASPRYAEDGIVFAGAHDGVYRLDGPNGSWQPVLTECVAYCIAVDDGDRDARPDGSGLTVFVGTSVDGILVSRNGGRSWEGANAGLLSLSVYDLAISPAFAEDGIAFAATGDGLYRTRNGGEAWRQLDTDTGDKSFRVVAVSPNFSEDRRVLAGGFGLGLFWSDDGGRSWERCMEEPVANQSTTAQPAPVSGVIGVTLLADERAAAWTDFGVALSSDGGRTFRLDSKHQTELAMYEVYCGVWLPADGDASEVILAGTDGIGIHRSEDGGHWWSLSSSGLDIALVEDLFISPIFAEDQTLYAMDLDGAFRSSDDGGYTWGDIRMAEIESSSDEHDADDSAVGTDEDDCADHIVRPRAVITSRDGTHLLLGASAHGLQISADDGKNWNPAWNDLITPRGEAVEAGFVHALATVTTAGSSHILAATHIERSEEWLLVGSRDGGKSWIALATPSPRAESVRLTLTPDAGLDGPIYVATGMEDRQLTVFRSTDGGQHWQVWLDESGRGRHYRRPILALPANSWGDTVVMAVGNHILRPHQNAWETKGGVRRPVWDRFVLNTKDGWGLDAIVSGLAASPAYAQDRTLFAATSAGVFVSRDGGATFLDWNDGLDPPNCVAVAVSPAYAQDRLVYALGLGGTVWRRTDA